MSALASPTRPASPWRQGSGRAGDGANLGGLARRAGRALAVAGAAAALAAASPSGGALAQADGVVAGRLVNGSAGGEVPAGAEVVLHQYRGSVHQEEDRQSAADARGAFRFEGLRVGDDLAYQISTAHGGVLYGTAPLPLTPAAPARDAEVVVYESTGTDPGLRALQTALVLDAVDVTRGEVQATELVTLANPADRTYVPTPSGPSGAMGLPRFGLPLGARELRAVAGLTESDMIQVDRGFASSAPVLPGEQRVGYAYRIPYNGTRLPLEKGFQYGASVFLVLIREGGVAVETAGVEPSEPAVLGGVRYRTWAVRDLPPGTRLRFTVTGLPPRPVWRILLGHASEPGTAALVLAVLGAVAGTGALWARRRRIRPGRGRRPAGRSAGPDASSTTIT